MTESSMLAFTPQGQPPATDPSTGQSHPPPPHFNWEGQSLGKGWSLPELQPWIPSPLTYRVLLRASERNCGIFESFKHSSPLFFPLQKHQPPCIKKKEKWFLKKTKLTASLSSSPIPLHTSSCSPSILAAAAALRLGLSGGT